MRLSLALTLIMLAWMPPTPALSSPPVCVPAKDAVHNLLTNEYQLVLYREEDHKLVALFADRGGFWVELILENDKACAIRAGRGIYIVRERGI